MSKEKNTAIEIVAGIDVGNEYTKSAINKHLFILQSQAAKRYNIMIDEKYNENQYKEFIEDIENEMDCSFTTPLVKDTTRRLFGRRALQSHQTIEQFDIMEGKAENDLYGCLLLGTIATYALRQHYENVSQKIPGTVSVNVKLATALPINEFKKKNKSFRERILNAGQPHLVTIHNFEVPIIVQITFTAIHVASEGEAAQYGLAAASDNFLQYIESEIKEHYGDYYADYSGRDFVTAKNTLGIDIGGGTMDIIISDVSYHGQNILEVTTPYEPAKHDEFAGARFDYELMKKFMKDFLNYYELYDYEVDDRDRIILEKRMLLIAEDAKKFLCNKNNTGRTFEWTFDPQGLKIALGDKEPFHISLTKRQMDIALEGLLNSREEYGTHQSIRRIIRKTLTDNNLTPSDIDCIYLTGGMANYDKISETIRSVIQKPVIIAEEPLFCTATGVALSLVIQTPEGTAELMYEPSKKPDPVKPDIVPPKCMGMSYYIDVENRMPVEIISKDESYPSSYLRKANVQFRTSSQSRMKLVLYEGHSIYDCNMRLLRSKTVEFNEMVNIGTAIDISYKIDANKIITIYASIDGEPPFEFSTEEK